MTRLLERTFVFTGAEFVFNNSYKHFYEGMLVLGVLWKAGTNQFRLFPMIDLTIVRLTMKHLAMCFHMYLKKRDNESFGAKISADVIALPIFCKACP